MPPTSSSLTAVNTSVPCSGDPSRVSWRIGAGGPDQVSQQSHQGGTLAFDVGSNRFHRKRKKEKGRGKTELLLPNPRSVFLLPSSFFPLPSSFVPLPYRGTSVHRLRHGLARQAHRGGQLTILPSFQILHRQRRHHIGLDAGAFQPHAATGGQPERGNAERRSIGQINHHAGLHRP